MDSGGITQKGDGVGGPQGRRSGGGVRGWLHKPNPEGSTAVPGPPWLLGHSWCFLVLLGVLACLCWVRHSSGRGFASINPSRCRREIGDLRRLRSSPQFLQLRQKPGSGPSKCRASMTSGTHHPKSPSCWCPGLFKALPIFSVRFIRTCLFCEKQARFQQTEVRNETR